jgi:hypothetical protein
MASRKTVTFEELRDRNEAHLDTAGHTPDVDLSDLTSAKRKRVLELLEDRAEIEGLASTQSQREEYGVEQWHEGFVRLRDIPDEKVRAQIWDMISNSRFKRFQQAFCHPHQFIVPRYAADNGSFQFIRPWNFNTMSLKPCLVSPDLIPEKLSEDLGLISFEEGDSRKPRQRLEKKAQPQVAARLKEIWEHAVPLQYKSHRLMVVKDSDEALNGTILYTRTEENGDLPNSLRVQHFSSAYSAHRKTLHEGSSYRAEIAKLSILKQDIKALNTRLNRDWCADTPQEEKDAMREEASVLMAVYSEALQRCENKHKVKAHDLLDGINGFHDKSGKVNPSASLTKMVAAMGSLESRFKEMYPKGGYNEQDRMVLQEALQSQEHILRTHRTNLQKNAGVLTANLELFQKDNLSTPQISTQSRGVLRRLHVHPDDLQGVSLMPFTVYAGKMKEKHEQLSFALNAQDHDAAKSAAVEMFVIGKFQSVRSLLERIREHMADGSIPLSRINGFVSVMRTYIDDRQVLPGHDVASYNVAFSALSTCVEEVQTILSQASIKSESDTGSRSEMYKELRTYIEEVDLEEMVRDLP